MKLNDQQIKEILLSQNYVSAENMGKAEAAAKAGRLPLVEWLIAEQFITKDLLGQAVADFYGVPYSDLNSIKPSPEQILKIPEETAKKFRAVLFKIDAKTATMATDNPGQKELAAEIEKIFKGKEIKLTYSLPEDIDDIFIHYRKPLETRFAKIIKEQKRVAPEIIEEIFKDAHALRASDIHFEPQDDDVVIRFRVDGVLHEVCRLSKENYEGILNRVKVQARMRIDEHFSAQDGAIRWTQDDAAADIRVSVAPTLDGEKIEMRILSEYVRGFSLGDLGLSPEDQELILATAQKPFGMILVAGPTGSGKTTTMYGVIKFLNKPEVNIVTIEDPVEYKISGVNHIQVNPQTNLTYAQGLKSIIRQDPDIILVGEIRDKETAEIAVNAALTGHLLLTTFHANDAAAAVSRLLDIGVEPFLLSSTVELIFAQRLVRKICPQCRYSFEEKTENLKKTDPRISHYFPEKSATLYKGKGCDFCQGIGYKGRTAIFEFIRVTPKIQNLILKNPTSAQIWELAEKQGSRRMFEDGMKKVKAGITTLEELARVVEPA